MRKAIPDHSTTALLYPSDRSCLLVFVVPTLCLWYCSRTSPNNTPIMASPEQVELNQPHAPGPNAIEAFNTVLRAIKSEIVRSRHHWDKHEPKMWSRIAHLSDHELTHFTIEKDLVVVRSGATSYGNIIFGKIRIPAVNDDEGEGFIHVRIHDPPNHGTGDVKFHSILTVEGNRNAEGHPTTWRAIQTRDAPLEFFNE
ncbi:hypothetical protein AGABI1DRAFT_112458 [Agaricus bisporus var. burnettii JB137-S8]|uniref:Uncharacterized protein n=2 Tax=Agaricus bisporus var. burnettii TaxID=192524 RepID=K5WYX9_AGABU|nr:uncharacterized protein AGABI1DRAFT_112458 [Agaricus bisporus var. burnettii JB137-S8]EKM80711.1 hypothetical protein AGABI1DRAFT_112458 [Agaricus bisporus var. burnettii JB137-S8]